MCGFVCIALGNFITYCITISRINIVNCTMSRLSSVTSLKPHLFLLSIPSPTTTNPFFISVITLFYRFHINRIIYLVSFWDWPLLFDIFCLRLIHLIVCSLLLLGSFHSIPVCLTTHLLKSIWVVSSFWLLQWSCYKHSCPSFFINMSSFFGINV